MGYTEHLGLRSVSWYVPALSQGVFPAPSWKEEQEELEGGAERASETEDQAENSSLKTRAFLPSTVHP